MRPIWTGAINFGLVNVPVALYPAAQHDELKFRLLRAKDLSPVNFKRVAAVDGKEVPWNQIVKGYEYEKDRFVVLKDEDFKRVDVEATQTIDIVDFVEIKEINPIFFYKPYFLEPLKGGNKVYGLLRDVLAQTGKAGITKVVIKTREHLAALKANGDVLVLELMHFADELRDHKELRIPAVSRSQGRELDMAQRLIEEMSEKWDPARYKDDYKSALMRLIRQKVARGGKAAPARKHAGPKPANVIDLVSVLRQSLAQVGQGKKPHQAPPARKKSIKKRAA